MSELALAAFAAAQDEHAADGLARSRRFESFRATFDASAYRADLAHRGVRWISRTDPAFPPRLRCIHDPPPGLFVRGGASLELLGRQAVAVVGARACSDYGAHVAQMFAADLAVAGVVVVSGLARGVDGWAHRGALGAGGVTVAVLGCGIDRDYPRAHSTLAARICETGLVVSEYPPGVAPAPWRFPARNRIVAGLALATVVVEARERSGALITADLALEEGREVLAVPGPITSSLSAGANALLRVGAIPATAATDVLAAVGIEPPAPEPPPTVSKGAHAVLAALEAGAATADEIGRAAALDPAVAAAALTELELAGLVREAAGVYRR
ncbi:MAG TPA: DNA-processing protein DprA [Gaiellaceae bacterium]|jgi:DNA processing protein